MIVVLDDLSLCPEYPRELLFTIQKLLPPPAGYANWLDYAAETFSTRQAWLESLWETWVDDTAVELDRDNIRESARLELRALRKAAAADDSWHRAADRERRIHLSRPFDLVSVQVDRGGRDRGMAQVVAHRREFGPAR